MEPARWLLRRPSLDTSARLFCFPYSGCGASMYRRWPRQLGDCEVCLIQPPARENRIREAHYETYEAMAAALVEFLPPFLDRPFGIFGHCGGALPAVELAYQLGQAGLPTPQRVFVSSQVAPQDGPYGRLLTLGPAELADELGRLVVRLGGAPVPKLIDLGVELLSRDLAANRRYRPSVRRSLPGGITVIGWSHDHEIPLSLMSGWRELSDDCRYVMLPGDHYDFLGAPPALLAEFERDVAPPVREGA
jgi:surfactin synthase thioesterase subunit